MAAAVKEQDEAERDAILARLAESRAEIRRLLEPPPPPGESDDGHPALSGGAGFPRSRTMQMLMSGRGLGALGALAAGLLVARPALAWRLFRLLPTSTVARVIIARVIGTLRTPRE